METWKGYDAWKTRTPNDDAEHHPLCPQHEDAVLDCDNCDGAPDGGHTGDDRCIRAECKCDELRASDKADEAEYRADCRADR